MVAYWYISCSCVNRVVTVIVIHPACCCNFPWVGLSSLNSSSCWIRVSTGSLTKRRLQVQIIAHLCRWMKLEGFFCKSALFLIQCMLTVFSCRGCSLLTSRSFLANFETDQSQGSKCPRDQPGAPHPAEANCAGDRVKLAV